MSTSLIQCEYCLVDFARPAILRKHYERCKQKPIHELRIQYEIELKAQREQYENRLHIQRELYETQLQRLNEQLYEQKQLVKMYQDQIFEIAKQPTTINNTNQNQTNNTTKNTAIINQLAPYDLTKKQVTELFDQHFDLNVFKGGPTEIVKMTAQMVLTDQDSQKPKLLCTDLSRKIFRYTSGSEVQIDPGFQKTHDLIKDPLSSANFRVFDEELQRDDQYRDQWRKNEDFISDRTGFSERLVHFVVQTLK